MSRRAVTVSMGIAVVAVLGIALALIRTPYASLGPGPTANTMGVYCGDAGASKCTSKIITVTGRKTSASAGKLNFTTVSAEPQIAMTTAIGRWFSHRYAVVPNDVVFPPDQTRQQTEKQDKAQFTESENHAEVAALREVGYPVRVTVRGLANLSPSKGRLKPGDMVTAVDDKKITSRQQLVHVVSGHKPGDSVTVHFSRDGKAKTAKVTLTSTGTGADKRAVLGIDVDQKQPHPFTVKIEVDEVGGPSAGLMLTLGLIDELTPADLTGGKFIAGTGTIDDDGAVGPIGGIHQKLVAAREAGASVFLTPADNCAEAAMDIPKGLKLASVDSLQTALTALKAVRAGKTPAACAG